MYTFKALEMNLSNFMLAANLRQIFNQVHFNSDPSNCVIMRWLIMTAVCHVTSCLSSLISPLPPPAHPPALLCFWFQGTQIPQGIQDKQVPVPVEPAHDILKTSPQAAQDLPCSRTPFKPSLLKNSLQAFKP
ncbi:hypothetical protein B0H14DRAFT_2583943 [Mycena olivaceomarginata]|nr:hypothetical protein B0H14DRAFT_2583943 [Mycena olivaceomarginata]